MSSRKTDRDSVPSTATSLRYGTLTVGSTASTPESRLSTTRSVLETKTGAMLPVGISLLLARFRAMTYVKKCLTATGNPDTSG